MAHFFVGSEKNCLYISLDLPLKVVHEKFPENRLSRFCQLSETVHSVVFPFASIVASVCPLISSEPVSLIVLELTMVAIPVSPGVHTISMLLSVLKISYILFSVGQLQSPFPVLNVFRPGAFIDIPIFVEVDSV